MTDEEEVEAAVQAPPGPTAACGSRRCAGVGWAEKTAGKRGPHQLMPFETVLRINLIGTFNVLRFAAAAMLANEPDGESASAACASTPPRSPPTTDRSGRSPTRPPRAASWA